MRRPRRGSVRSIQARCADLLQMILLLFRTRQSDRVVVHLERRSHNPILREAALEREAAAIPWWQGRHIHFVYS
jgi:hypothetical protein